MQARLARLIDWKTLAGPLLGLGLCALLGTGLIAWSENFRQTTQAAKETRARELESAYRLYEEADATLKIIKDYHPAFKALQARGFFGEDQRLNWINQLHQLQGRLKMSDLRYQIEAQAPYTLPGVELAPGLQIYQSAMTLELGLLHEGDLFRLLGELAKPEMAGLPTVKACELRLLQHQTKNPRQNNLSARCTLLWYTVTVSKSPFDNG